MKLREIMTRQVHLVSHSQTIQEAAQMMRDEDIGMLPVFNGAQVIGVLTDRDIVVSAVARGLNPTRAHVTEAMTKNVIACQADTSINEAAQLMKANQIRRLVVIDRDKRPIGIVSIGDIATRVEDANLTEDVMHEVSEDRNRLHPH